MLRSLQANPEQVHKAEHLPKILGVWNALFNVMTLMSNQLTPFTETMELHQNGMIYWCHWDIIPMEE